MGIVMFGPPAMEEVVGVAGPQCHCGRCCVKYFQTYPSPIGPLIVVCEDGHLTGLMFDGDPLLQKRLPQMDLEQQRIFGPVYEQLDAYFAGKLRRFELPLKLNGTPFQVSVWESLVQIPYSQTWSYSQLAQKVGQPKAMRAVGAANGRNPIVIIVPCHRVIGANGSLTGFGGGLPRKKFLLDLEAGATQGALEL